MKTVQIAFISALTFYALPAMAHVGPEAVDQHFIEHLVIALVVGMPLGYLLLRMLKGRKKGHH